MRKKTRLISILVAVVVGWAASAIFLVGIATAAEPVKVWVPKHTLADGTVVPGDWR